MKSQKYPHLLNVLRVYWGFQNKKIGQEILTPIPHNENTSLFSLQSPPLRHLCRTSLLPDCFALLPLFLFVFSSSHS